MECSRASLSFALKILAELLCFSLCLFDVIVELHALNEKKMLDNFLFEK